MTQRLAYLLQLLEAAPQDTFLLFAIAKEQEKQGDLPQALAYYERLRTTDASYVGLYYHLGKLYEQTGQEASAIATYQAGMAVARRAGDAHALSELAVAKLNLVDDDE